MSTACHCVAAMETGLLKMLTKNAILKILHHIIEYPIVLIAKLLSIKPTHLVHLVHNEKLAGMYFYVPLDVTLDVLYIYCVQ